MIQTAIKYDLKVMDGGRVELCVPFPPGAPITVFVIREPADASDNFVPRDSSHSYPTIGAPSSSLNNWLNLVPSGYDGDALADTEALYDEV